MNKKPEMAIGVYGYKCTTKKVKLLLIDGGKGTPSDMSILKTAVDMGLKVEITRKTDSALVGQKPDYSKYTCVINTVQPTSRYSTQIGKEL